MCFNVSLADYYFAILDTIKENKTGIEKAHVKIGHVE